MRFGVKAAAAAMAMAWAMPASAVIIVISPLSGAQNIMGNSTECGFRPGQDDCIYGLPPVFFDPIAPVQLDVPVLDGTYSLNNIRQNPVGSLYIIDASVRFAAGALQSSALRFTYQGISPTINGFNTSTFATGTFFNNEVFIPSTGVTLRAVPEPATWAMMLIGLASIGYGLRNRASRVTASARSGYGTAPATSAP